METEKVKVYVYSLTIPTLGFIDKEGAQHACARAGSSAFSGLKHYPSDMDKRYLSKEEREALIIVEKFCRKNGYEFEVIDVSAKSFLSKLKLKAKGIKDFPTLTFKDKVFSGVPSEETLQELVQS